MTPILWEIPREKENASIREIRCVCARVWMCVRDRERERKRVSKRERRRGKDRDWVGERERERRERGEWERESEWEIDREREHWCLVEKTIFARQVLWFFLFAEKFEKIWNIQQCFVFSHFLFERPFTYFVVIQWPRRPFFVSYKTLSIISRH